MEPGSLLDISVKMTFEYFPKYVEKIQASLKLQTISGRLVGTLQEDMCTYITISRRFFLETEMFQTKLAEKIKTHILDQ